MRVYRDLRCSRDRRSARVVLRARGGARHRAIRHLFLCVRRKTGYDRGGRVCAFAAVRIRRIPHRFDFVSDLFSSARAPFRRAGKTGTTEREKPDLVDYRRVRLHGWIFPFGLRDHPLMVRLYRGGDEGVFLRLAVFHDSASGLHGGFGGAPVPTLDESIFLGAQTVKREKLDSSAGRAFFTFMQA